MVCPIQELPLLISKISVSCISHHISTLHSCVEIHLSTVLTQLLCKIYLSAVVS